MSLTAWLALAVFATAYRRHRHREVLPHRGGAAGCGRHGGHRLGPRTRHLLLRGHRDRLERHLLAVRDDGDRRHPPPDGRLRVPGHLVRTTSPRTPVPDDGAAGPHHRRRLGVPRQRDHRAVDRTGDSAAVRSTRPGPGAVPAGRGHGQQHRRHRHADRRPAQHHHREPGGPGLQRLPGPPHPHRRGADGGVRRTVLVAVGTPPDLRRRARRGGDATGTSRDDLRPPDAPAGRGRPGLRARSASSPTR